MADLICPNCGQDAAADSQFCIFCGASLSAASAPEEQAAAPAPAPGGPAPPSPEEQTATPASRPDESGSFNQEIRQVRQELQVARRLLNRLMDRVEALDRERLQQAGQTPRADPAPPPHQSPPLGTPAMAPPAWPQATLSSAFRRIADAFTGRGAAGATTPSPPPSSPGATAGAAVGQLPPSPPIFGGLSIDWENVLGRNWFAIIGAVALTIGVGFFLKLAFDNDWIGETGRIVLGIAAGLTLLGAGEYTERRYPRWAQPVTAGGITVLYLSIYAGFALYDLTGGLLTFSFLTLVVLLSALLALRYESLVIALMGIIGAFVTPLLLGETRHETNEHWLLVYIFIVDLGILGISTFRNWRWFTLVGMVGSYGLFAIWQDRVDYDAVLAGLGLTGIFLVFIGATTLFHIVWRRRPGPQDMSLIILNASAFYALTFAVLWNDYELWFGLISLGISLLYGLVAWGALKRSGAPPELVLYLLAAAVVFLTIAVPLQLSGHWITVAWAVEGAVVVWVGFILNRWSTRAFGLGILAVAAFNLLIFDTPVDLDDFTPVLNYRFPTFVVTIAAFYLGAYLYWLWKEHRRDWERYAVPVLVGAANLFTLWLFSAEVIAYFESRELAAFRGCCPETFDFGHAREAARDALNGKYLTLTGIWALYAAGLMAVAWARGATLIRWAALALLGALVFKLLLVDTFKLHTDQLLSWPIINFHFLTFMLVLGALLFAAYLYWRESGRLSQQEEVVFPALVVIMNFAALWVLSVQAIGFFDNREVAIAKDLTSAKQLSLTVLWAVYAIGLIAAGIIWKYSRVRLAGIGLLTIAVGKLFVFDVFQLERGYRVAAFVTLGAILLGIGLIYQRYSQAVRGFLFGRQA